LIAENLIILLQTEYSEERELITFLEREKNGVEEREMKMLLLLRLLNSGEESGNRSDGAGGFSGYL